MVALGGAWDLNLRKPPSASERTNLTVGLNIINSSTFLLQVINIQYKNTNKNKLHNVTPGLAKKFHCLKLMPFNFAVLVSVTVILTSLLAKKQRASGLFIGGVGRNEKCN